MGKSVALGGCVVLAVAAHAALLTAPWAPAVTPGAKAASSQPLQVRRIEAPVPQPVERAQPAVAERAVAAVAVAAPAPAPVRPPAAAESRLPSAPKPASPSLSVPAPALARAPTSDDDVYVPRALLSLPPTALTPVVIDYPAHAGTEARRYTAQLTLFIDETGAVVRVRAEGTPLPPALEEAARSAFMSARFAPGQMAEHGVVKSRIRVEVVFDSGEAGQG